MEKLNDKLCKVCGESFGDRKEVHKHVKKEHGLMLVEYYTQCYTRYNLLDNTPIGYRGNVDQYFSEDFFNTLQMKTWIRSAPKKQVMDWMLSRLKDRIEYKGFKFAPTQVEIETLSQMPDLFAFEKFFGSYEDACKEIGYEPLLKTVKDIPPMKVKDPTICIDTREQTPLSFSNSKVMALAYADYTLSGDDYNYTYVDRKSGADFLGTFGKGYKRFERELQRAIDMDSFIYVVIENSIGGVICDAKSLGRNVRTEYSFKNMRKIQYEHPQRIQFVFTGSRHASQKLIPFLLSHGEDLWDYDVYFALRKKGLI